MILIDFTETSQQAFSRGFLKGLAAPMLLYQIEAVPALPAFVQVEVPGAASDEEASRLDWAQVGAQLKLAIQEHAEDQAHA